MLNVTEADPEISVRCWIFFYFKKRAPGTQPEIWGTAGCSPGGNVCDFNIAVGGFGAC